VPGEALGRRNCRFERCLTPMEGGICGEARLPFRLRRPWRAGFAGNRSLVSRPSSIYINHDPRRPHLCTLNTCTKTLLECPCDAPSNGGPADAQPDPHHGADAHGSISLHSGTWYRVTLLPLTVHKLSCSCVANWRQLHTARCSCHCLG
jgi:hypothetical protein